MKLVARLREICGGARRVLAFCQRDGIPPLAVVLSTPDAFVIPGALVVPVLRAQALQGPPARRRGHHMTTQISPDRPRSNRGFASMDLSKQREIASKGGKAAHAQGRAHEFTADEARDAGRKGGEIVSRDRDHMAAIGRAGGQARGRNRALRAANGAGVTQTPAE
jgi:general stress protein YciG